MNSKGFTLVEITIILVVVGLLITAILSGRELIEQSKIRNDVILIATTIPEAVKIFEEKYSELPGDFDNALALFPDCYDVDPCNGNGNGKWYDSGIEVRHVFEHLYLAGLVKGPYSAGAVDSLASSDSLRFAGVYPALSIGALFAVPSSPPDYNPESGNAMRYSQNEDVDGNEKVVLPSSVKNIDEKIDDGKPNQGKMRLFYGGGVNDCADPDDQFGDYYTDENNLAACKFSYDYGF